MIIRAKRLDLRRLKKFGFPSDLIFRGTELKFITKELSKIKLVGPSLDLGCGDGFLCRTIFREKFDYGLDNDEAGVVKEAIKKKRYKKVIIESATNISLPSKSLNLVFSNSVVEHIPNNYGVLQEVSRILKKNGYFIFTCPSVYFTDYLSKNFGGKLYSKLRNRQFNHFHLYDHKTWKKRLAASKMRLVDYRYYMNETDLVFWEKLLWQQKMYKYFPSLVNNPVYYRKEIIKRIKKAVSSKYHGANILIIAKKK